LKRSDQENHQQFLQRCLILAQQQALLPGGGPFAAIVVKDNEIIAEAGNQVTGTCDPTAHAEVVAIRTACASLQNFQLHDCIIYSSCEPCPMCLGAIFWARPKAVYFAATREQAAAAGFDDGFIYQQISVAGEDRSIPFHNIFHPDACMPFSVWKKNGARRDY
jgi:guanine deaminase